MRSWSTSSIREGFRLAFGIHRTQQLTREPERRYEYQPLAVNPDDVRRRLLAEIENARSAVHRDIDVVKTDLQKLRHNLLAIFDAVRILRHAVEVAGADSRTKAVLDNQRRELPFLWDAIDNLFAVAEEVRTKP